MRRPGATRSGASEPSGQLEAELAAIFGEDEILRRPPDPFEEKILTGRNSFSDLRDQLAAESDPAEPAPTPAEPASTSRSRLTSRLQPEAATPPPADDAPLDAQSRIAQLRRDLAARAAARNAEQSSGAQPAAPSRFFREGPSTSTSSPGRTPSQPASGDAGGAPRTSESSSRPASVSRPTSADDRIAALRRDLASRRAGGGEAASSAATEPVQRPATGATRTPRVASTRPAAEPQPDLTVATRVPAEHTTTPSRPASATARPAPSRPRSAAEPGREPSRVVTPQPTARPSRPTIQPAAPTPAPVEQVDLIDESLFIPEQGIAAEVVEAVAEQALPTQTTRRREPEASAAPVTQPALAKPRPTSRPEMEPPATKPAPTRPRPVAPAMAHTPSGSEVVALRQVTKVYGDGATQVEALRGVDLGFTQGGLTVILGPAGAGKSTLLHCMAGLETPTSGVVTVAGHTVSSMNAKELAEFRRSQVGFIFSAPTLLDGLTVAQNIQLASDIKKEKADEAWFDQVVDALGLADVLSQRPAQLSPLQQQAVACARAIITKPVAVFADEPCAQLDSAQAFQFTQLLLKATRMLNQTVVMATADPSLAARGDRTIFLSDGVAVDQIIDPSVDKVLSVVRSLVGARAGA